MSTESDESFCASSEAIHHHYDIDNEFYRLWLDPDMVYSSALWDNSESLQEAQIEKLDYHIRNLGLDRSSHVLDVGCGWGAMLNRLVGTCDVESVVGLTLSEYQLAWINENFIIDKRIEVKLESWEEHIPKKPYDAIVSIGSLEHFARSGLCSTKKVEAYRSFFKRCHGWLNVNGMISLQAIVYERDWTIEGYNEFLTKEILPESDLPFIHEIVSSIDGLFEIVELRNDRTHYVRTLRAWLKLLRKNRSKAVALVGEGTVGDYEKYFQLSMYAFQSARYNLTRITLRKINI